jgi:hypothetical protein
MPLTPPLKLQVHPDHILMGYVTMLSVATESRDSDGLRAGRPVFESRQGRDISLLSFQTGFGAHLASVQWVPGALFPGGKAAGARS